MTLPRMCIHTGTVGRNPSFPRRGRSGSKTPDILEVTRDENTGPDGHTNRKRLAQRHTGGTDIRRVSGLVEEAVSYYNRSCN